MVKGDKEPIKRGDYAYAIAGEKIIDMMRITSGGSYIGKPVQQLIDDGWHFVCDGKDFKKKQECLFKPFQTSTQLRKLAQKPEPPIILTFAMGVHHAKALYLELKKRFE